MTSVAVHTVPAEPTGSGGSERGAVLADRGGHRGPGVSAVSGGGW